MASVVLVQSLDRRVFVVVVMREFCLRGGLKGEVAGFSLEQGNLLFHSRRLGRET